MLAVIAVEQLVQMFMLASVVEDVGSIKRGMKEITMKLYAIMRRMGGGSYE